MASSKSCRQDNDLISNVPDIVTDKILELLPIRTVARTSMLSKQWRRNWLSHKRLIFDEKFCYRQSSKDGTYDWQKCSNIISSVLLHHNGPIHEFNLYIPNDVDEDCVNLSQWLSFLSKNEVIRRIDISNWTQPIPISSHIFLCTGLVQLELDGVDISPPPVIGFGGFSKLQHLVLLNVYFSQPDILCSLIAKCRILVMLRIEDWEGMDHIVIDVPRLETLTIDGEFQSLAFGNVCNLRSVSVCLKEMRGKPMTMETGDAINNLSTSSQIQCIQFGGQLHKFLVAGVDTFNHLKRLCLKDLQLNDLSVLRYVFGMVERCPYIKELDISVEPSENAQELKLDCNYNLKMDHLVMVKIEGITGSSAELKLIEYLLTISIVLEKLFFKCAYYINTELELQLLRAVTGFSRASTKARLISLM